MNHSVSTDVFGYAYADARRNRERAIVALAKMQLQMKPIRKMGPMNYSAKNITPETEQKFGERECKTTRDKLSLREKCLDILRKMGPQTTAEIGRELRRSTRSIALALREVVNINEEQIHERSRKKAGAYVDGIRWSLPGMAKVGAA